MCHTGRRRLARKPLFWLGDSLKALRAFPDEVKDAIGHALHVAQVGGVHKSAKSLAGFGGRSVLEVAVDFSGNSYRAVYATRVEGVILVIHVFQKKSKQGIATPRTDLRLIRKRLRGAEQDPSIRSQEDE
jgi:phage-related protein